MINFKSKLSSLFFIIMIFFTSGCGKKINLNKSDEFRQFDKFLDSLANFSPDYSLNDSLSIDNINGIKQEDFDFFQSEGYNIDLEVRNQPLDNKSLNEIKSKYEINSKFILDTINANYFCYSQEEIHDSIKVCTIYYVIGLSPKKSVVVSYRTNIVRNLRFELKFNNLVRQDSIPKGCFSNMQVDSIKFAGRYIQLGGACQWQGVNNIQCPHMGQMNWSEFQNIKPAIEMIRSQIKLTQQASMQNAIKAEYIDILFEGNKTKALRLKYKINLPKVALGGSNTLIAYYVVSAVRNRYVACVLSHYDDDAKEGQLPPLLSEVMKLN